MDDSLFDGEYNGMQKPTGIAGKRFIYRKTLLINNTLNELLLTS